MRVFGQVKSALTAALGILAISFIADAGVVRNPGNNSVAAPALSGETHLISDAVGVGAAMPSVGEDYIFHNGSAPHVSVSHAGVTVCEILHFDCWGEYLPDETAVFGGAIWGGSPVATLSYEMVIRDDDGFVLYTFTDLSSEAATLGYYEGDATPGNPCVGAFLYGGIDVGCQYFEMSMILPDGILYNEWYAAEWSAIYTAPAGMHFATNLIEGGLIESVSDTMWGMSSRFNFKRVRPVNEAPAIGFLVLGGLGLAIRRRKQIAAKQ